MSNKRPKLSKHTEEVIRLKFAGITNVEIARQLGISDERVRQIWLFHVRRRALQYFPEIILGTKSA